MDLRLERLSRRFGDRLAVDVPELTIGQGEFFTFVGPSGCGKSTLLNLIAGLDSPSSGSVYLGDRCLDDLAPHRRDVAFVFQSYALYPNRTVRGNLSFPLELAGTARADIARRVSEVAELLGLAPLLDTRPRELSGGERQRVALGRAIVRQPKLFLFDEPLSNLDAPLRAQMRRELKRLHRELGRTFVYVTHDQEEALSLSQRVAVMEGGRIRQCAPPTTIYRQPADTFVAAFFGSPPINLFTAHVEVRGAEAVLRIGRRRWRLGPRPPEASGDVLAGVRPEDLRMGSDEGWEAVVRASEQHGGMTHVELDADELRLVAVDRADSAPRVGDRVRVDMDGGCLHFFDPSSGRRLGAGSDPTVEATAGRSGYPEER